ncbi:tyrosine kinase receptor Cad96Ca-like [Acanthaster planci]|uniref:Tyrosine kinase receptor Cad96Ca-like n=1 Tax=Acanthaster planci TaxID=133434 RepID=A0A8B7ZU72_ACAPL|nr:tyrosine kinase receptor Cad96Ca-like [Acanthaster planci]
MVTEIPSTEKSSNVNIGGIAGGAILCFGILVLLFVLEIFLRRRTLKKRAEEKLEAAKKSLNCGYEIPRKTLEETSYNIIEETTFSHSNKEQESSINSDTSEWEDDFQLDDQSTGSKDDDNLPPKQNHSDGPSVYQDISEFRKLPSNGPELALPTLRESCLEQNIYQSISERETPQYGNVAHPDKAFPRGNLKIIKELGRGTFSRVLLADADGIVDGAKVTLVAVKTVHGEATEADKAAMLKELNVMKTLPDHPNIIQLLGYCTDQDPPYIILEFLAKGNLKDFLHYSRSQCGLMYGNLRGLSKSLSPKHFLKFAKDVADGMEFIASQQCIHRDLAARNVLVADDLTCKVADFGLARDIMNTRLYERRSACQLPLRWMALETIIDDVYTTESDVWSFGVLLWEIVTFGARPYPNMHHTTMIAELQKGYRMPKPLHCTTKLYRMMLKCWRMGPERRPTFTQISDKLKKLLRERKECISMRDFVEHIYEVTVPHGDHEKV